MSKTLLELVRDKRAEALKPATDLLALVETEQRDLTSAEFTTVQETAASETVKELDARIATLTELNTRNATATLELPKGSTIIKVRSEPLTYGRHDPRTSYFKDLGMAHVGNDQDARQRLARMGSSHRGRLRTCARRVSPRWSGQRPEA
jgi:hypothetical protein